MDSFVYERIKNAEENDWWYRSLRKIIFQYIKKYHPITEGRLLDIGCGTGYLLKILERNWDVYGVDISLRAVEMAKSKGLKKIRLASIENLPFGNNFFDVILVLDVIEHVQNDRLALSEVYRVLKPGGIAIFNTPAFQFLWSYHDISAKHVRRYTATNFSGKLRQEKFSILKISYINSLLFPFAFIHRLFTKFFPPIKIDTDIGSVPGFLTEIFYRVFAWESFLLERFNLPWGLSVSAVVTK